jgi:type IV secretory pathway VirB3-like protein
MHVRQRIANVTVPPTVLVMVAKVMIYIWLHNILQIGCIATALYVFQRLMSAKKFQTPATRDAPTFRGVSNVVVPRGTKVMG